MSFSRPHGLLSILGLLAALLMATPTLAQSRISYPRLSIDEEFRPPVRANCARLTNQRLGDLCIDQNTHILKIYTASGWIAPPVGGDIDVDGDGTADYTFVADTCTDHQYLRYDTATGGISCVDFGDYVASAATGGGLEKVGTTAATLGLLTTCSTDQVLSWDGSAWVCSDQSGGSGTPGGSDQEFQYNNAGTFGGASALTWNGTIVNATTRFKLPYLTSSPSSCVDGEVWILDAGDVDSRHRMCLGGAEYAASGVAVDTDHASPLVVDMASRLVFQDGLTASANGSEMADVSLQDCAANEILKRNSGDTAWVCSTDATGGGSGSPAGSDRQLQFNDAGAFGGASGFQYYKSSDNLQLSDGTTISCFNAPTSESCISGGDLSIVPSMDSHASVFIGHGVYCYKDEQCFWTRTHASFGSRAIKMRYNRGIVFYADNVATTADAAMTPTERMVLDNSGQLGIGNPSPSYTLDVTGTGRFTSTLYGSVFQVSTPSTATAVDLINSSGSSGGSPRIKMTEGTGATDGYLGIDSSGYLTFWDDALAPELQVRQDGDLWTGGDRTYFNGLWYTWPATIPAAGYVLSTDASGVLSWVAQSGGSGSPGGSDTQVQYNDAGAFGAQAGFAINKTSGLLRVDGGIDLDNDGVANLSDDGGANGSVAADDNLTLTADDDADLTGRIGFDTDGDGTPENWLANGMTACSTGEVLKASAAGVLDCGTDSTGSGGPTTDDAVLVGNGSGSDEKVLPDCSASTDKLLYTQSTNTWSCGTDQTGGSSSDPLGTVSEVDDFISGEQCGNSPSGCTQFGAIGWYLSTDDTADILSVTTSSGHPGIIRLAPNGTKAASIFRLGAGDTNINPGGTDSASIEFIARSGNSGTTSQFYFKAGFTNTTSISTEDPSEGVYFRASSTDASAGRIYGVCRHTGVETTVDTGVDWANTWHKFKVVWNGSASADFYVDGTLSGSCTTNLPVANLNQHFYLLSRDTTLKRLDLDYYHFTFTLGTSR